MEEKMYVIRTITPAHSGFGMYQVDTQNQGVEARYFSDIRSNIDNEVFELGVDELPEEVADIRGRIYDEPTRVFVVLNLDDSVSYFGLDESEETIKAEA